MCYLEKCLLRSSAHFQRGYVELYEFSVNSGLSGASFVNTVSFSLGSLLVLLMVSFTVQKLFCLMQSHLSLLLNSILEEIYPEIKLIKDQCQRCLCFVLGVLWFKVLYLSL